MLDAARLVKEASGKLDSILPQDSFLEKQKVILQARARKGDVLPQQEIESSKFMISNKALATC